MTTPTKPSPGGKRPGAGRKAGPTASAHEKYMTARAAKEAALARIRQAEADQAERLLIPASEVESVVGTAFSSVAQALLNLPDKLEQDAALTPEQAEIAERVIHQAMNGLADDLQALGFDARD